MSSDNYQNLMSAIKSNRLDDITTLLDSLSREEKIKLSYDTITKRRDRKCLIRYITEGTRENKLHILRLLLQGGLKADNISYINGDSYTPLQIAVCRRETDVVSLLLEFGESPDKPLHRDIWCCKYCSRNHKSSDNAVSIAIANCNDALSLQIAIHLFSKCEKMSRYDNLPDGRRFIQHAIEYIECDVDDVRKMDDAGCDVLKPSEMGIHTINQVFYCEKFSIGSYLISTASPRQLQATIPYRCHDMMLHACDMDVPLNTGYKDDYTPLFDAIEDCECLICTRILLENGADPNVKSTNGTPVYNSTHCPEILVYLLDYPRTDITVLNNGQTYIDLVLDIVQDCVLDQEYRYKDKWQTYLKALMVLFRHMGPITSQGCQYLQKLIMYCSKTMHKVAKGKIPMLHKTLLSVTVMARAYLPGDAAIRDAICLINDNQNDTEDPDRRHRVGKILLQLQQMTGVSRLDFLCKIAIRKYYDVSDLPFLLGDNLVLPHLITTYICDNNYSSMNNVV